MTPVPQDQAEKVDHILNRVIEAVYASGAGTEVPEAKIAAIENEMTNDPKDRHVLAAAVVCGADTVVTTNTKDFPPTATTSHGITAKSPDEFLVNLLRSAGPHGPAIAPTYVRLITSDR